MKKLLYTVLTAIIFVSCSGPSEKAGSPSSAESVMDSEVELTPEQLQQAGITIATPELRVIDQTVHVKGVIDVPPTHKVSVSVPMGGYLKVMRLVPGMKVGKGERLCEIEDARYVDLQQEYLVGKSKLALLESDYARQKDLAQSQSVSQKAYQQAASDYASQKAIVAGLAEKLRLIGIDPAALNDENISRTITIRAPISGQVSKVNVNAGQYVDPTSVLFEVISSSDIHLSLTVFENDLSKLAVGQTVICYTNSEPAVKYAAKIALINRNIDEERASEVHCHLEKQDKLVPGMFMNADIHVQSGKQLSVPEEAVVRWENRLYVFLAESDNKFVMTPVEVGASSGGFTAVNEAFSGKRIVTSNAYSLLMKLKNNAED